MTDYHAETLHNDPVFHRFMDQAFPDWRTWDVQKQRLAAKRWNYTRLYSLGQEGLDKLKDEING